MTTKYFLKKLNIFVKFFSKILTLFDPKILTLFDTKILTFSVKCANNYL